MTVDRIVMGGYPDRWRASRECAFFFGEDDREWFIEEEEGLWWVVGEMDLPPESLLGQAEAEELAYEVELDF